MFACALTCRGNFAVMVGSQHLRLSYDFCVFKSLYHHHLFGLQAADHLLRTLQFYMKTCLCIGRRKLLLLRVLLEGIARGSGL
jgi:hypothetical protein